MYRKILVPLDGSDFAERALDHIFNLAPPGGGTEVVLVHVLDPLLWCRDGHDFVAFRNFQFSQAERYLDKIASRLASREIRVSIVILEGGVAAATIIAHARDRGVDLIVMTSHGRTGIQKLMFGSVALEILHESHVPVLLIRA
jgi:nucleotide-binding universal stress UspA family protein